MEHSYYRLRLLAILSAPIVSTIRSGETCLRPTILASMEEDGIAKSPALHLEDATSRETTIDPAEMTLWKNLRKNPKVAAYCLGLTSVILLWGYDLAMTSNLASLPEFQYVALAPGDPQTRC